MHRWHRHIHFKGSSLTELPRDLDGPAVTFDNGQDAGQTQSGALARFLRREKRLENLIANLWRNAGASILDLQNDIRTRTGLRVPGEVTIVRGEVAAGDP